MRRLTQDAARRIALAAQGLARPAPPGRRDRRHFRKLFTDIGLLQLDSVNVVSRSHYLPVFARLGHYDRTALDAFTSHSGEIFEYWAHVASLVPVERYPLLRWRMEAIEPWGRIEALLDEHPGYVEAVYEEIAAHGPLTMAELSDPGARTGPWWGHGRGRSALDWLFSKGRITAYRDARFGRVYDLPERVIPAAYLDAPAVPRREAYRSLLQLSARYLGVGTARDLGDYYRLHMPTARSVLSEMGEAGELIAVDVDGWRDPAYLHPEAKRPRRVEVSALLSPFDSMIFERDRTWRLFDFHYRIEIYVPAPQRVHGYYVLPFLLDGRLVGRVDLKAHRARSSLEVRSCYAEDGVDRSHVAGRLAEQLRSMAGWLGLHEIEIASRGDLAPALRRAV